MQAVDFSSPADFYPARRAGRKTTLHYRRFDCIAEAIRYAIEQAPPSELIGTLIECDEQRYGGNAITALYQSDEYPLVRSAPNKLRST